MEHSANGWSVLSGARIGPRPRLRYWKLPGAGLTLPLRDGAAGLLLCHFALWFDEGLEHLHQRQLDDWGWANRTIRGSSTISNHASGTAADLNATQHPIGVPTRRTFTDSEVHLIHARLGLYAGCIAWGGDWIRRADAMHFEISRDEAAVIKVAHHLEATPRAVRILAANPGALEGLRVDASSSAAGR